MVMAQDSKPASDPPPFFLCLPQSRLVVSQAFLGVRPRKSA